MEVESAPARLLDALQEDSRSDLEYSYFLSPFLRSIVVLFFGGPKLRGPMLLSAPVLSCDKQCNILPTLGSTTLAQPTTCARARNAASMESKTLRSHRVIGEVADGTPQTCAFYDLGGVGYCAVRVGGDAFQVMALDGLTVQSASPRLGRNIRAIGAQGEWTYCAIDDEVWCFLRARFVGLAAGAPAAVDRFELCANQPVRRAHPAILP